MIVDLSRASVILLCAVVLHTGCAPDSTPSLPIGNGPGLVVIDSMRLDEPDSAFLSFPTSVERLRDGRLLIGDATSGRILEYSPDGHLIRPLGRRGQGPGEFVVPGAMSSGGDTVLAVTDWQTERLSILRLTDGELVRSLHIGGLAYSLAWRGDTLFGGLYGRLNSTSGMRLPPGSDSLLLDGTAPFAYRASPGVRSVHPYISVAVLPYATLTGFTGSNELHEENTSQGLTVFQIPVRARRAMPDDIVRRFESPLTDSMIAGMGSTLVGLYPMTSDRVAAVHLDVLLKGQLITATGWVSVVDLRQRSACPDAPLGSTDAGKPVFTVVGDTLIVVEQRLGPAGTGESWVRRLRIELGGCDWVPLEVVP